MPRCPRSELTGDWIPGYFVFIETGAGTYLCDATADAQVWGFAEIGDPLTFGHSVSRAKPRGLEPLALYELLPLYHLRSAMWGSSRPLW